MSSVLREYKECTVVGGEIWNIGPWDYQYQLVQTGTDDEGKPIMEEVERNPFPENGVIEHRWFLYSPDKGWYEEGTVPAVGINEQVNRNFTDLFTQLVQKDIITIDELPIYTEFDFKTAVQKKIDGDLG